MRVITTGLLVFGVSSIAWCSLFVVMAPFNNKARRDVAIHLRLTWMAASWLADEAMRLAPYLLWHLFQPSRLEWLFKQLFWVGSELAVSLREQRRMEYATDAWVASETQAPAFAIWQQLGGAE